jgi:hypothetical protein
MEEMKISPDQSEYVAVWTCHLVAKSKMKPSYLFQGTIQLTSWFKVWKLYTQSGFQEILYSCGTSRFITRTLLKLVENSPHFPPHF